MLRPYLKAHFALLAISLTLVCLPALAADDAQAKIGIVDLQRVYRDAPRVKQFMEELQAFSQALNAKLALREKNMMTSDSEITELIDLSIKPDPTDADKAKMKAISDASQAKEEEFKTLQQTKEPDDAQKARLNELQGLRQKSQQAGETVAKDYNAQVQGKAHDLAGKADADVQSAVKQVADTKSLSMVLTKRLSGANGEPLDFVLLGGVDITDDVIAKLDRKAQ